MPVITLRTSQKLVLLDSFKIISVNNWVIWFKLLKQYKMPLFKDVNQWKRFWLILITNWQVTETVSCGLWKWSTKQAPCFPKPAFPHQYCSSGAKNQTATVHFPRQLLMNIWSLFILVPRKRPVSGEREKMWMFRCKLIWRLCTLLLIMCTFIVDKPYHWYPWVVAEYSP